MEFQELNIVIPVYNEGEVFMKVYEAIKQQVQTKHRLLVVYDFDEDTTVPIVKNLARADEQLILVKNDFGRGPANALRAGFNAANEGPILVVMADLADDLRDVDLMVGKYREGFQVICGSRYMPGGHQQGGPFVKSFLSRLAGLSLYYIRGLPTRDVTNNFKLYDGRLLKSITIESRQGFSIAMEITVKAFLLGKRITEVPTIWNDRAAGTSKFKLLKWLPQYLHWYFFAFQPRNHV